MFELVNFDYNSGVEQRMKQCSGGLENKELPSSELMSRLSFMLVFYPLVINKWPVVATWQMKRMRLDLHDLWFPPIQDRRSVLLMISINGLYVPTSVAR